MKAEQEPTDREHSSADAFAQGFARGVDAERTRIAAILNLPEAVGMERAAIVAALSGACSLDAVQSLFALYDKPPSPVTAAEVRARRAAFKIIFNPTEEDKNAGEAP